MPRPKVLLADDHVVVAQALSRYLQDTFDLVGIAQDGEELVRAAQTHLPDVIVADISMPSLSGLEAMRRLRDLRNPARFIFLTMHRDAAMVGVAMRAGASGFMFKNSAGEDLIHAIEQVLQGDIYLPSEVAGEVIAALGANTARQRELSPRQRDVLRLLSEGLSVKEIASELVLSPRTVESHKYEMMQVLGVRSIAQLVHYAIREGICIA